ncbi:MAG: hypothetical protein KDA22_04410 [Phycisphaerales bacterium]|nr:hypothetical protein [Phycisphaerales bacterium]
MSFRSGSVSYSRFRVFGEAPAALDESFLKRLADHMIRPTPGTAPPEVEAGWTAGRHILDGGFTSDGCLFGPTLLAGVRVDTNRVPTEVRRAYRALAESERAAATETGFLSRGERRLARDEADRRCGEELATGRHRRSRLLPVHWAIENETLLAPVSGDRLANTLRDLVQNTFGLRLQSRSAGSIAWDLLADRGLANDLDDALPSVFTAAPPQAELRKEERVDRRSSGPEVPWAAAGPEPKDFLGNEFLLWLWWLCEEDEGLVATRMGEVGVVIDKVLDMECAWGATGKQSLRGEAVTRLPEADRALALGKWPRRAGLILSAKGQQWELSFQADRFAVGGAKLPDPDDKPASVRELLEHRLAAIADLDATLVALFESFLRQRIDSGWSGKCERIGTWIKTRGKAAPARHRGIEASRHQGVETPEPVDVVVGDVSVA